MSTVRKTWRPFAPWARRPRAGQRSPRPRLQLEELEARNLLSGFWTPLNSFAPNSTGTMMLLTDGTVMAQGGGVSKQWYQLAPDASGSYINGSWSARAAMGTQRLYFASNVLPDGRALVMGGEYSGPTGQANWTNTGEIYDPLTDTWTSISNFPRSQFGDDPSAILPDGRILLGYLSGPQTFAYDPASDTYTQTGTKLRNDRSDEESWVQLPDQSVLSYDVFNEPHAQRYFPALDQWLDAGTSPVILSGPGHGSELGPAFALPDGRAIFFGANGNTAFYDPNSNTWTAGTPIPGGLGADDAPGALMPNGHILIAADTPLFHGPTHVFEFDPTDNGGLGSYTDVTPSGYNLNGPAYGTRMLMLPSGQVLFTNGSGLLTTYTPNEPPDPSWQPTISGINDNGDGTFTLSGTLLSGISEGSAYGDDAEMSSNYPIVQLTDPSGNVFYARTTGWSYTGISAAGDTTPQSTLFTPPAGLPADDYSLVVIANGIPSAPVDFPYGLGPDGGAPAALHGGGTTPPTAAQPGPVLPAAAPAPEAVASGPLPETGAAAPVPTQADATAGKVGALGSDLALAAAVLPPANAGAGAVVLAAPATGTGIGGASWDTQAFGLQRSSLTSVADPGGSSRPSASQEGNSIQALDAVFQQGFSAI